MSERERGEAYKRLRRGLWKVQNLCRMENEREAEIWEAAMDALEEAHELRTAPEPTPESDYRLRLDVPMENLAGVLNEVNGPKEGDVSDEELLEEAVETIERLRDPRRKTVKGTGWTPLGQLHQDKADDATPEEREGGDGWSCRLTGDPPYEAEVRFDGEVYTGTGQNHAAAVGDAALNMARSLRPTPEGEPVGEEAEDTEEDPNDRIDRILADTRYGKQPPTTHDFDWLIRQARKVARRRPRTDEGEPVARANVVEYGKRGGRIMATMLMTEAPSEGLANGESVSIYRHPRTDRPEEGGVGDGLPDMLDRLAQEARDRVRNNEPWDWNAANRYHGVLSRAARALRHLRDDGTGSGETDE